MERASDAWMAAVEFPKRVCAALGLGGPKPAVKYKDVWQFSFPSVSTMPERLVPAGAALFGSGRMQ